VSPEEAINAASRMLHGMLTSSNHHSESDFRASMLAQDYVTEFLRHKDIGKLVHELSSSPDGNAWLCRLGATFVGQAENIPTALREYIVRRLTALAQTKPAKRGGATKSKRDFAITYVIARVVEQGFKPTRNQTRHGEPPDSACSIVREAMKRLGDNVEESKVEKIWQGRLKLKESLKPYILGTERIMGHESLYEIKSA
jgi:hypothetical protein